MPVLLSFQQGLRIELLVKLDIKNRKLGHKIKGTENTNKNPQYLKHHVYVWSKLQEIETPGKNTWTLFG